MARVRLRLTVWVVALALFAGLVFAITGGTASPGAATGPFAVVGTFDAAGNPEPSVFSFPDGAQRLMHWSMCSKLDAAVCHPIATRDGTAHPGPQPAGTIFKFRATFERKTYVSSLTWRGALHAARSPLVTGSARFGASVAGGAATWTGGWGTEQEQLGLEACRTAAGTGCVMLSGDELHCVRGHGCGSLGGVPGPVKRRNRARIGNWYTGWYLFALDAHLAVRTSGLVGYQSEAAVPPWPNSPTVDRSAPVGPITGPPRPQVRFFSRARVDGHRVTVASLQCAVRCHVWLTLSRTGRHFTSGERLDWGANEVIDGSATLAVLGSIPSGRFAVTIEVGNGPYVTGYTLIR